MGLPDSSLIKRKHNLDRQGQKAEAKIYNKITWEDSPKNPQIQAMGQTIESPTISLQEKAVRSNGVSEGSENWNVLYRHRHFLAMRQAN